MSDVRLSLACGRYDRTWPLIDGSVRPKGIDVTYLPMSPPEIFWRMLNYEEFDACEMSLSAHMILTSRDEASFVGIPVFPGRAFRHSYIFVNRSSNIKVPEDLRGKRVGVPEYHMTAAVFNRGMLADDYGVRPEDMDWYQGGVERPGRVERIDLDLPPNVKVHHVSDRTLDDMLCEGELDALFAAAIPPSFRAGDERVTRLFQDPRRVEADWYYRTKVFPIMHLIVISKKVYNAYPWVALSLLSAFVEAKEILYRSIAKAGTSLWSLPFYRYELEETIALFGDDFLPYGVDANRETLRAALRYGEEQHLLARTLELPELFVPSVLGTFAE